MRFGIKPLQGGRNFGTTAEEACLAEALGFDAVYLSEHHGVADGFYPALFLVAAAFAARTHRALLCLGIVIRGFRAEFGIALLLARMPYPEIGAARAHRSMELFAQGVIPAFRD